MDSLSQLALGASIGVAVMGRRTAVWKAAVWGGIAGTLPDLDVFIDYGNDLANMVNHRGESHSLFYLTLFSPTLAAVAWRIHERAYFRRWWLMLWLVLITHVLLDASTVYGTRLGLPFTNHAFGTGSLFIIDPLYTLPLLLGLALALIWRGERAWRANAIGLALSTLYIGWSLAAQAQVAQIARQSLPGDASAQARLIVTPTAFNTVLWRVLAHDGERYHEGFYSLFDAQPQIRFTSHDAGRAIGERLPADGPAASLQQFANGFVKYAQADGVLSITDLRMGQEPHYVFRFVLAQETAAGELLPLTPQRAGDRGDTRAGLHWVWQRMQGQDLPPPR